MKPHSGVNLDEGEWATLVEHFNKVKAVIHGEEVNLRECKRSHDADEIVKVYIAEWFLNDELLNTDRTALPFYSHERAIKDVEACHPEDGKHYSQEDGVPEMKVRVLEIPVPEDIEVMGMVFAKDIEKHIETEIKEHCQGCQLNSDSQKDHYGQGSCLDQDFDQFQAFCEPARKRVKVNDLMNVFDKVHSEMGVKPIFAKQIAKCALAWIPFKQVETKIADRDSALAEAVRTVYVNTIPE